jgi:hypothetical protein
VRLCEAHVRDGNYTFVTRYRWYHSYQPLFRLHASYADPSPSPSVFFFCFFLLHTPTPPHPSHQDGRRQVPRAARQPAIAPPAMQRRPPARHTNTTAYTLVRRLSLTTAATSASPSSITDAASAVRMPQLCPRDGLGRAWRAFPEDDDSPPPHTAARRRATGGALGRRQVRVRPLFRPCWLALGDQSRASHTCWVLLLVWQYSPEAD